MQWFVVKASGAAALLSLLTAGPVAATPFTFQFTVSFFYLGVAVVGGITSLGGGLASSEAAARAM